jgi:hypothetical protein
MAFLDNSGDIILDAVLTDTGRMRLAKGDGSFKIVKFALGDDEINYELFDTGHASGSAYYDLDILKTPVLEAFTDNAVSMKSKLVSIPRNNLLYLPVLKLNEGIGSETKRDTSGYFLVAVDSDSETELASHISSGDSFDGVLYGENPSAGANRIRIDQGLDTTAISPAVSIDPLLAESLYRIDIDNRLGSIVSIDGTMASLSFVDDDNIATYFLSLGTDTDFVTEITDTSVSTDMTIAGPRGTKIVFKIQSSLELNSSDYFFDTLGFEETISDTANLAAGYTFKQIKTTCRVTGVNTGYRIDAPIKFVKKN